MPEQVGLRLATASSSPSGTGSYNFDGKFDIVVENLAFAKQVSVRGNASGGPWQDFPATYVESVPSGREIWRLDTSTELTEFVARFTANGVTYWDNNWGGNYHMPIVTDDFAALLGSDLQVILGAAHFTDSTHIHINIGLKNLDYHKVVGIVYTTDNWTTVRTAYGSYNWTMVSGTEVWNVDATVPIGSTVQFAVFYQVLGQEFWDNNFWRNYSIRAGAALPMILTRPEWRGAIAAKRTVAGTST